MARRGHKRGAGARGRWAGWDRPAPAPVTVRHVEPTRRAEPMTEKQAAFLRELCRTAGEKFNPSWSKAQASAHIKRLKKRSGP